MKSVRVSPGAGTSLSSGATGSRTSSLFLDEPPADAVGALRTDPSPTYLLMNTETRVLAKGLSQVKSGAIVALGKRMPRTNVFGG